MRHRIFSRLVLAALVLASAGLPAWAAAPTLETTRAVTLEKSAGQVDQVVALPGGGYVVRDYTWNPPESQVIQRFDGEGHLKSEIAAYGHGSGKYVRLKDLAVAADGTVWAADFGASRVTHYGVGGEVLDTLLLQNPSYRPRALALAPRTGELWIAGCLPLKTYLNDGCRMVHRYRPAERKFEGSFLDTPPDLIERGWAGRADYDLDVAEDGTVYFVHATAFTLFRLAPGSEAFEPVAISSRSRSAARTTADTCSKSSRGRGRSRATSPLRAGWSARIRTAAGSSCAGSRTASRSTSEGSRGDDPPVLRIASGHRSRPGSRGARARPRRRELAALVERLGPPDRPWKILYRRRDHRMILEDPRSVTAAEREAFASRVRAIIGA